MNSIIHLPNTANITTGNLDSNAGVEDGQYPFFTCAPEPLKIDSYEFESDAILLAGNNASANFHLNRYSGKFNAYQRTYVITSKKGFDIDYIFYSLKIALKRFKRIAQGSQTKFLTMDILNSFEIHDIGFDEQVRKVEILKLIDIKISLNNKINQKLESMAKTIYNYWFVQFDFPDVEGKPYKASGGEMEWSDELKKEIPKDWQVNKIGTSLKTVLGGTPSTSVKEYYKDGNFHWLNSGEVAEFPVVESELKITEEAIRSSATELLERGSVLLSITRHLRPTILAIDACANQSVVGIKEKGEIKSYFLYPYLINEIPRLMKLRTGAQQPHINKEIVDDSFILTPNDSSDVLKNYNKKVEPIFQQIFSSAFETQELIHLRDFLLPLLMNGQVKVK